MRVDRQHGVANMMPTRGYWHNCLHFWIVVLYVTTQGVSSQPPCPPPFPDMPAFFQRTLQVFPRTKVVYESLKMVYSHPDDCQYYESIMGNLSEFNDERCTRQSFLELICTTTTSTTTTTTTTSTTTTPPPTTTTKYITTSRTLTQISQGSTTRNSRPSSHASTSQSSSSDSNFKTSSDVGDDTTLSSSLDDRTTFAAVTPTPGTGMVKSPAADHSVRWIIISLCGFVSLFILIAAVIACRRHKCVLVTSSFGVGRRRQKRNNSQRIAILSSSSMCKDRSPDSPMPKDPVFDTTDHDDSYEANVQTWSVVDQTGSGKYRPLNDSPDYPTLKAMEWDHALIMGGFGESSTDYTLRTNKKKPEKVETPLNTPEDCCVIADGVDNHAFVEREPETILRSVEKIDALRSAELYKTHMMDDRTSSDGGLTDHGSSDSQSYGTIDDDVIQTWRDEINDGLVTKENSHLFETQGVPQTQRRGSPNKGALSCNGAISQPEDSCVVDLEKADAVNVRKTTDKGVCLPITLEGKCATDSCTSLIEPPDNFKDSVTNLDLVEANKPEQDIASPKEVTIVSATHETPSEDASSACEAEDVTNTSPTVHNLKQRFETLSRPSKADKLQAKRSKPCRNTFAGTPYGQETTGKGPSIEDISNPVSELERALKKARRNTLSGDLDDDVPNTNTDIVDDQTFEPNGVIGKLNGINRTDVTKSHPINDENQNTIRSHDAAPPMTAGETDAFVTLPNGSSLWNMHSKDGQRPLARVKPQLARM